MRTPLRWGRGTPTPPRHFLLLPAAPCAVQRAAGRKRLWGDLFGGAAQPQQPSPEEQPLQLAWGGSGARAQRQRNSTPAKQPREAGAAAAATPGGVPVVILDDDNDDDVIAAPAPPPRQLLLQQQQQWRWQQQQRSGSTSLALTTNNARSIARNPSYGRDRKSVV